MGIVYSPFVRRHPLPLEPARGRQRRPARGAGSEELGRAAVARRPGSGGLTRGIAFACACLAPTERRRITPCADQETGRFPSPAPASTASHIRQHTSLPTLFHPPIRGSRRRSTGTRRWATGVIFGRSASASPKRWTPRSE